jgi:hypothetical protein
VCGAKSVHPDAQIQLTAVVWHGATLLNAFRGKLMAGGPCLYNKTFRMVHCYFRTGRAGGRLVEQLTSMYQLLFNIVEMRG